LKAVLVIILLAHVEELHEALQKHYDAFVYCLFCGCRTLFSRLL